MPPVRPAWWSAGTIIAALAFAGAGFAAAPAGGTLTVGLDQDPPTLDPHASPSAVTFQITSSIAERLLYEGRDGKIVPYLATGYQVSADGKSFTFTLRKDVKFSDGTPFNAAAVKWNFDRIVDPNFKAGGALAQLTGYSGATVVDDSTVRVNFKEPYAPFLTYAAGAILTLISPETTAAEGDAVNQKPVGSGPFMVAEYVAKDHIILARNREYHRRAPWGAREGSPYLERVVFKIIPEPGTRMTTLQSGATQMISALSMPADVLTLLQGNKSMRVERVPYPGAPRIWLLNVTLPPTDDLKFRQALSYGIDRGAFVRSIYSGLGEKACSPLTQHMLSDPSLCAAYPYNLKKAAQLLDEDGWKMGANNVRVKDGKPLTVLINSINYGAGNLPEIELLRGQLLQLGIDARIRSQARPPWYEDNYQCATNGPVMFLRATDWEALFALFSSRNVHGNFNWSCYSNPDVDRLLGEGTAEFNPAKRRAIYLKIERILVDQAVTIPLVDEYAIWVIRSSITGTNYDYSAYPLFSDLMLTK